MDYLYLEKTVREIGELLTKRRLSQVCLEGKKLTLAFGKELFLNAYFSSPNALFASKEPIAKEAYPPLLHLKGAYVKEVALPYPDRVVELSLVKLLSATKFQKYYLIFELTGKNANLFLLDGERRVKFLLRPVLSSVRELSVKEEYQPPPLSKKPFEELTFGRVTPEGIEKSLYKHALYISPLNAKEIACLYRSLGSLEEAYKTFMERHRRSSSAYLYYREGKPAYLTTFPYCSLEGLEFKEFSEELPFSRAWEELFREKVLKGEVEELRRKILDRLKKRREALEAELLELQREEELKRRAEELKRMGELLKFNLHLVEPGAKEVKVRDYGTGEEVLIPLEPSLSPKKNMERLFKEYKKALKKAEISAHRRAQIEEELSNIKALEEVVSTLEERERLRELLPEVERKRRDKEGLTLKLFTLPTGRRLIVGRSSKENEVISMKLSNPWDLWLHAKEMPGSHVILKLNRSEAPTDEELLLAASAAAYFSRGRASGKVPVDYTRVKNLKKPPGSPAGFVTYTGQKTIWVKPELFEEFLKGVKAPAKGGGELTGKQQ